MEVLTLYILYWIRFENAIQGYLNELDRRICAAGNVQ